uniref:Uncharacterized protein n=1 Tax=Arundo donax TaxID=35708 RepID=A0A0A9ASV5_ARUDO
MWHALISSTSTSASLGLPELGSDFRRTHITRAFLVTLSQIGTSAYAIPILSLILCLLALGRYNPEAYGRKDRD